MRQQYFGGFSRGRAVGAEIGIRCLCCLAISSNQRMLCTCSAATFKISPERVTQQFAEVRNCKWCALLRRPDVIRFAAQVAMRCVDSTHSPNIGTHTMLMPESSYA